MIKMKYIERQFPCIEIVMAWTKQLCLSFWSANVKRCIKSLYTLFFIVFTFSLSAQNIFEHYTLLTQTDGLLGNNLNVVYCDRNNFIWVGSNLGLQVYNGSAFYRFPVGDGVDALYGSHIRAIIDYDKDHVLVGTDQGISKVNIIDFSVENKDFKSDANLYEKTNMTQQLLLARDGRIWAVTTGAVHLLTHDLKLIHTFYFPTQSLRKAGNIQASRIIEMADGHVRVIGPDLSPEDGIMPTVYELNPDGLPFATKITLPHTDFQKYPGIYQVNDTLGIYFYGDKTNKVRFYTCDLRSRHFAVMSAPPIEISNYILFINRLSNDRFGVSTYPSDHYYQYEIAKKHWTVNDLKPEALIKSITSTANILFAATEGGLLRATQFSLFTYPMPMPDSSKSIVRDVVKEPNRNIFAFYEGILKISDKDDKISTIHYLKNPFNGTKEILSIERLGRDSILVHGVGNYIYNLKTRKTGPIPGRGRLELIDSYSSTFSKDKKGNCWFGFIKNKGIVRYDKARDTFICYPLGKIKDMTQFPLFSSQAEDKHGDMWFVSTIGSGMLRWNHKTDSFSVIYPVNKDNGRLIRSIAHIQCDSKGMMWLGSEGGGLACFDPDVMKFSQYTISDGLPGNYINRLTIDDWDNIWGITEGSLFRLNPLTGQVFTIKHIEDMPCENLTDITRIKNGDGAFIISGYNGSAYLYPDRFSVPEPIPDILLRKIIVNQKPVELASVNKPIHLAYNENNLEIYFDHSNLMDSYQNKYYYRLSNGKTPWIYIGDQPVLRLSGLGFGDYSLEIRVCQNGNACFETKVMRFSVGRPFWRSPWFFLLTFTLIGSLIFIAVNRTYHARLAEKQKELDRELLRHNISQDIHDEIGTSLTRITLSAQVGANLSLNQHEYRDRLLAFEKDARDARSKLRDIVFSINPGTDTVEDIQVYIKNQAVYLWEGTSVELHFDIRNDSDRLIVNPEVKRNLLFICKETYNNIAKYASASNVYTLFCVNKIGEFSLEIRDDGKGFDIPKTGNNTFGLSGMRRRAEKMDAQLNIDSAPDKGTAIRLSGRLSG